MPMHPQRHIIGPLQCSPSELIRMAAVLALAEEEGMGVAVLRALLVVALVVVVVVVSVVSVVVQVGGLPWTPRHRHDVGRLRYVAFSFYSIILFILSYKYCESESEVR